MCWGGDVEDKPKKLHSMKIIGVFYYPPCIVFDLYRGIYGAGYIYIFGNYGTSVLWIIIINNFRFLSLMKCIMWVRAWVRACVCHAVSSETTTVTHFW